MKRISSPNKRADYFKRHFSTFIPHLTFKKIINLLINEIEMQLSIASPKSFPPYIKVEPTPLCHLRCPGCLQKDYDFKKSLLKLNNGIMYLSLENLKTIINPIRNTLIGVSLSHYGEPMLNPRLSSLIEYLHNNNIAVNFPTNLSIKLSDDQIVRLVKSGLDCIEVSLDGATEDSYNMYRVGGDFKLVLKNVRSLANTKRDLGTKRPRIVWKFIEFEHNKNEIEMLSRLYKDLGFDSYEIMCDNRSKNYKDVTEKDNKNMIEAKKTCYWLWNTITVRWDGSVRPCCTFSDEINLGNAIENDIKKIWQSQKYKSLREGFNKKYYGQKMESMCKRCIGMN